MDSHRYLVLCITWKKTQMFWNKQWIQIREIVYVNQNHQIISKIQQATSPQNDYNDLGNKIKRDNGAVDNVLDLKQVL